MAALQLYCDITISSRHAAAFTAGEVKAFRGSSEGFIGASTLFRYFAGKRLYRCRYRLLISHGKI